MVYTQEENHSIETIPEEGQMLDLPDKLFKLAIMNMFQ